MLMNIVDFQLKLLLNKLEMLWELSYVQEGAQDRHMSTHSSSRCWLSLTRWRLVTLCGRRARHHSIQPFFLKYRTAVRKCRRTDVLYIQRFLNTQVRFGCTKNVQFLKGQERGRVNGPQEGSFEKTIPKKKVHFGNNRIGFPKKVRFPLEFVAIRLRPYTGAGVT